MTTRRLRQVLNLYQGKQCSREDSYKKYAFVDLRPSAKKLPKEACYMLEKTTPKPVSEINGNKV